MKINITTENSVARVEVTTTLTADHFKGTAEGASLLTEDNVKTVVVPLRDEKGNTLPYEFRLMKYENGTSAVPVSSAGIVFRYDDSKKPLSFVYETHVSKIESLKINLGRCLINANKLEEQIVAAFQAANAAGATITVNGK